jgi:hypothetical protein
MRVEQRQISCNGTGSNHRPIFPWAELARVRAARRRWLAFELREQYLKGSRFKFPQFGGAFSESEDGAANEVEELPLFRQ